MIHTGATVKPGTYESSKQQAGLTYYTPSYFPYYIDDSTGNLTVTISTVNGNIVSGYFSGTNYNGKSISNGKFFCRIKNYSSYLDSPYKWKYVHEQIFTSTY